MTESAFFSVRSVTKQSTLDTGGKAKEGPSQDHVAADGGEGNEVDGKDLEQHSSRVKGLADITLMPYTPPGVNGRE